jgi:hypothetical protein
MNRESEVSQWLERVAALDRQYVEQLNEVAAADELHALDAPFQELSEQERLALVAGVDAELAAVEVPKSGSCLTSVRTKAQHVAPAAPERTPSLARASTVQRLKIASTGLALAAALALAVSNTLFSGTATSRDANLPEYVLHAPRADSEYRGAEAEQAAVGESPTFTIGRTLEFVLQPTQRSEVRPRVWAFDVREPERPLPGLETTLADGGGLHMSVLTGREFVPPLGTTQLVFLLGPELGPAPTSGMVNGTAPPAPGFRRVTFALQWRAAEL